MKSCYSHDAAFARLQHRVPQLTKIFRRVFGSRFAFVRLVHDKSKDKMGADLFVILKDGTAVPVDAKIARNDPWIEKGDRSVALEVMSCKERGTPGYLLCGGKITRYLVFLYPTAPAIVLPFRALAKVFRENVDSWIERYGIHEQTTGGIFEDYHSSCVFVPTREIHSALTILLAQFGQRFIPRTYPRAA